MQLHHDVLLEISCIDFKYYGTAVRRQQGRGPPIGPSKKLSTVRFSFTIITDLTAAVAIDSSRSGPTQVRSRRRVRGQE